MRRGVAVRTAVFTVGTVAMATAMSVSALVLGGGGDEKQKHGQEEWGLGKRDGCWVDVP